MIIIIIIIIIKVYRTKKKCSKIFFEQGPGYTKRFLGHPVAYTALVKTIMC